MDSRLSGNAPLNSISLVGKTSNLSKEFPAPDIVEKSGAAITVNLSIDQEKVIADLQKAIRAIQGPQKSFEISMHEKTNTIMIKVLDKETGELVREVPPEKILDLAAKMMEITGLVIDEKI